MKKMLLIPIIVALIVLAIFIASILFTSLFFPEPPEPPEPVLTTVTNPAPVINSLSGLTPYINCSADLILGSFRQGGQNFNYYICDFRTAFGERTKITAVSGVLNTSLDLSGTGIEFPYSFPEAGVEVNESFELTQTGKYSHLIGNPGAIFCGNCTEGDYFLLVNRFVIGEETLSRFFSPGESLHYLHLEELCKKAEYCDQDNFYGEIVSWTFRDDGRLYTVLFYPDNESSDYQFLENETSREWYRITLWDVETGDGYACRSRADAGQVCLTKTTQGYLIRAEGPAMNFTEDSFASYLEEYIEAYG